MYNEGMTTCNKERLMETAVRLIWQNSYATVGVAEICREAGLTKGSFYHHFESKANLFYESALYYWQGLKTTLDAIYSPEHTPLAQLELLIEFILEKPDMVDSVDGNPVPGCPFFTSGSQICDDDEIVQRTSQEMTEKAIRYKIVLVQNLKNDGALMGNPDPVQVGRILHQYIMGLFIYGRVMASRDAINTDMREGIYRTIGLKHELWASNKDKP